VTRVGRRLKGKEPLRRTTCLSALSVAAIAAIGLLPAGAAAATSAAPPSLDFGSQQVGTTSAPQGVTLTTPCTMVLPGIPGVIPDTCASIALDTFTVGLVPTGDFAVSPGTCGSTLVPGPTGVSGTCTATVTFSPTADGPSTGTLSTGTETLGLVPGPTVGLTGTGFTSSGGGGAGTGTGTGIAPSNTSNGTARRTKCKKAKKRSAAAAKKRKCKKKRK
jgi:hypothetical protein